MNEFYSPSLWPHLLKPAEALPVLVYSVHSSSCCLALPPRTQGRSKVSRVGSGHGHSIYGLPTVPALICQHKTSYNWVSDDRGHLSPLPRPPLGPTVQGPDALFWNPGIHPRTQRCSNQIPSYFFWPGDILKGKPRRRKKRVLNKVRDDLSSALELTFH